MKKTRLLIIAAILFVCLTLIGGGLAYAKQIGTSAQTQSAPTGDRLLAETLTDRQVVRVYYDTRAQLDAVAGNLDIWEVQPDKGYFVTLVTAEKFQQLVGLGYKVEVDAEKTAKLSILAELDARYYYFDNDYVNDNGLYLVDFLTETEAAYPDLTQLIDIGDAWQASHGGHHRDLWVLRITNEDPAYGLIAEKPAFVLFAATHAREVATPELAIRYIKYLTSGYNGEGGYGIDPDVTWLVNHNVAYILAMDNPDGHRVNEANTGAYRRKNMDNDDGCNDPGSWGTDTNRNNSFFWNTGGSSGYACDETYHGPSAGSEPEVYFFQDFVGGVIPDQNGPNGDYEIPDAAPITTTGIFISLHSYSDLVLWPWGHDDAPAPNAEGLETIGRKFALYNNYTPYQSWNLYQTSGTTDELTYGRLGIPSFTFEVGSGFGNCGDFFPDYDCIDGTGGETRSFWAENKPAFLFAHKISRSPYLTSYGPDAEDLVATPGVGAPGDPVELLATIADHRYGGDPLQPISAAEYFVDAPGEDGSGTPLDAADGSFGGLSEDVTGILDTTGLSQGLHYILIHGQNDDGTWGPFTAVFLYMMDPGVAPVIQGYVRDSAYNTPLEATVTAGNFTAFTDPATGFYSLMVISGTYDIQAEAFGHITGLAEGVLAENYATVEQNFFLEPLCLVFEDDVESGNIGWTVQSPWAITEEASHSPTHSWTESPGGNYNNNRNISLTSPIFDLSGYTGATLSFWHIYDTEPGFDYGYVEYSTNGGANWTQAISYNGYDHDTWTQEQISLPALDGENDARIRFRFYSDGSQVADGWHLDDITISGNSPTCFTPVAPVADFTSDSPVLVGDPVHFTNLVYGTPPLDFAWDFGDAVGSSTDSDPVYTYPLAGIFSVTMAVTNALGSDTIIKPVIVNPTTCEPVTEVSLDLVTPGVIYPGDEAAFSADIFPDNATKMYTYTVDYGDSTPPVTGMSLEDPLGLAHTYAAAGEFTAEIGVWNCDDSQVVTDTASVTISPIPVLEGVELTLVTTGTLYIGDPADFSADLVPDEAWKPYTYTVYYGDETSLETGSSSDDPLALTHTFLTAGAFTVEFSAWSEWMTAPVTDTVTVNVYEAGVCVPLVGITIAGPTEGEPGVYTFTTTLDPADATLPVAYLWDNGDTTPTSTRTLGEGTFELTVAATNCEAVTVNDTHTIVIAAPKFFAFLPVMLR